MAFAFHRRWVFCRPTGIQNFHKIIPPCKKKKRYIPKMLTPNPTEINWAHKTGSSRKMYQLLFLQGWLHSAQFSCSDPWGYVYVCMRVCVYACMYVCMYVCLSVCMYVYTLYMILSMYGQSSLALRLSFLLKNKKALRNLWVHKTQPWRSPPGQNQRRSTCKWWHQAVNLPTRDDPRGLAGSMIWLPQLTIHQASPITMVYGTYNYSYGGL